MTEMIIPGTYITVRAEGLISAGRVATGIVGMVGTAARGPLNSPITLAGFAEARELFGLPDDFNRPEDGSNPLTLVRSLEQTYNNGASSVIAVRVAGASASSATYAVLNRNGQTIATLTALTPGSWGNAIQVDLAPAETECSIVEENHTSGFDHLTYARVVPSAQNRIRLFRGVTQRFETRDIVYKLIIKDEEVVRNPAPPSYRLAHTPVETVNSVNHIQVLDGDGNVVQDFGTGDILYNSATPPAAAEVNIDTATGVLTFGTAPATDQTVMATYASGHADPTAGQVLVTTWDGHLAYATGEAPVQANGDRLVASYLVDREDCAQLTLTYETTKETYTVIDGNLLAGLVNARSTLATAAADAAHGADKPQTGLTAYFGTGSNSPGGNGADAGNAEYAAGLESLANMLVNIIILAGQDSSKMGSVLEAHLKTTEETDYERIGVIGAPGKALADFLGHTVASDRIILVAPGIKLADGTRLPPAYTAAAVAGLISSLPVQTSLTNKTLVISGVDLNFNRGQQVQLIKRNVLSVIVKNGFRVLKGLTTEGEGQPFSAIPTRRIVDYAKYGVRSAANPYIGRLNNVRVRAALQATLEGFLTGMVEDEALTGFDLSVTATRAQEIAGEVSVVMTLQPTFSIDYIRVTMNLK
jgi:hypothetical protein